MKIFSLFFLSTTHYGTDEEIAQTTNFHPCALPHYYVNSYLPNMKTPEDDDMNLTYNGANASDIVVVFADLQLLP